MSTIVKALRTEKGLTQVQLATRARVTQAYIAQLEGGARTAPSLPMLKRLAKALGVSVSELVE